eukprot:CAMPEP_0178407882 /NCGR_PEP_ID=MMETSP0689_2-20121128/19655_1 /TAXON_ID=160604 /ORGANISM="Amphidinium massartii, Strain CS-259" /LENGTH=832 /DNA_ID=CAMNT_0020028965 /DNA_START=71 /DNA_END=2565 /DNA_ORIENTATION=-
MVSSTELPPGQCSLGSATLVDVLLELFAKADCDKDGVVSVDELLCVADVLNQHPKSTGKFLLKYLESCTDGDGCVRKGSWERYVECCGKVDIPESILADFVEIVDALLPDASEKSRPQQENQPAEVGVAAALVSLFDRLDVSGNQSVPQEDLSAALCQLGEQTAAAQLLLPLMEQLGQSGSTFSRSVWCRLTETLDTSSVSQEKARQVAGAATSGVFLASLDLPTIHTLSALPTAAARTPVDDSSEGAAGDTSYLQDLPTIYTLSDLPAAAAVARTAVDDSAEEPSADASFLQAALADSSETNLAASVSPLQQAPGDECSAPAETYPAATSSTSAPAAAAASAEEERAKQARLADLMMRLYDKLDTDSDGLVSKAECEAAFTALKRHPSGAGYFLVSFLESASAPSEDGNLLRHDWEHYVSLLKLALTPDVEEAFVDIVERYDLCPAQSSGSRTPKLDPAFLALWQKATGRTSLAAMAHTALPRTSLLSLVQEIRQAGESGLVLSWHLSRAPFLEQEIVTFDAYRSTLLAYSFPQEVSSEFSRLVEQLDMNSLWVGSEGMMATSSMMVTGEEEEDVPAYLKAGSSLVFEEFTVPDGNFDLSHVDIQKCLLPLLGLSADSTFKALISNCGGLNEGVFICKDPLRRVELVLKLVKAHRRRPQTPTDTESFRWLVEQCPHIVDDALLAFPRKIISMIGSNAERTYDIIVMKRCPGRSLSEIVAGKLAMGKVDVLLELFAKVGSCLAEFHVRYGGWQHGDFTPSNIFHDERLGRTSFIDVGDVGRPQVETDVEHFLKALEILEKAYGQKAPPLTSDCFNRFVATYEEEKRQRTMCA